MRSLTLLLCLWSWTLPIDALPEVRSSGDEISAQTFASLEELSRVVDIAYCVGTSGVQKPFKCLSRCDDFEGFELVTTWNTGPLLSDSCGYIAVSHPPHEKRIIVAFRGTYSIANTIADLSTSPAEYAPFPSESDNDSVCAAVEPQNDQTPLQAQLAGPAMKQEELDTACPNCTVHSGFMTSWHNTRCTVVPHVERALVEHPGYDLVLVGHSLGGAVAALAALEFQARGWSPRVTTFGEPRIGNAALNHFINMRFNLNASSPDDLLYRRVTHVDDPVPLLPLEEWGYTMHAGEIYISKPSLPPERSDLRSCVGDDDPTCIAGEESTSQEDQETSEDPSASQPRTATWGIGRRYRLWELFFAHRDYFWRLGLCVPGGDPWDWSRDKYAPGTMDDEL